MKEEQFEEGYFTFKQFRIHQQQSAMKVGTDAVLLGSWMSLPSTPSAQLLDIGTGTGVISLFAAQRLSNIGKQYRITAVEPDTPSCGEAAENFAASRWGNCLQAVNASLQEYAAHIAEGCMDMIFSNPPYFIDSLKAPDLRRSTARHTDTLPFGEMVEICGRLLKNGGTLAVILPPEEGRRFLTLARGFSLEDRHFTLSRLCHVRGSESKPVKRWMMEFLWAAGGCITSPEPIPEFLTLQEGSSRSAQYSRLTADFYVR